LKYREEKGLIEKGGARKNIGSYDQERQTVVSEYLEKKGGCRGVGFKAGRYDDGYRARGDGDDAFARRRMHRGSGSRSRAEELYQEGGRGIVKERSSQNQRRLGKKEENAVLPD